MNNQKYKEEYKNAVKKNTKEVLANIESKEMAEKISNWANKFEYSFEEIKKKILTDEIFACIFIKEPSRQNLYQKLASQYISSLPKIVDFKMPAERKTRKMAKYMVNGKMFKGVELEGQAKDIKSIDFEWKVEDHTFFASHKYTKDGGGVQDNQYEDIQNFLRHARDCNIKNAIFLAICDGDYYLTKDSKTGDETKIERLKRLTDGRTSFVLQIDELNEFLQKVFAF